MDVTFLEGIGATVTSTIIFCGSAMFLMALVMGMRLAYFVTAAITLGFLLMMDLVWAFTPLGPVGQLPEWDPVAISEDISALDFGPAQQYPEGGWRLPDENDQGELTKASELESGATGFLTDELEGGEPIGEFDDPDKLQVLAESGRLLEQDGDLYGAITFEEAPLAETGIELGFTEEELKALTESPPPTPEAAPTAAAEEEESSVQPGDEGTVVAVMRYDEGNINGPARMITLGTALLLGLHLFGLSRAEKKAREERERLEGGGTS